MDTRFIFWENSGTYFDDSKNLLEEFKDGNSHILNVHKLKIGHIVINPGSVDLQEYKQELDIENNTADANENHSVEGSYIL